MVVNIYSFGKKPNSTARPSTTGESFNCNLKDGCGITAPVIELQGLVTAPDQFNYAYIPDFNRYYFIRDWTYYRGVWSASLDVDPLASYKNTIGASSQYILRSAAESDGTILDTYYPTKDVISQVSKPLTNRFAQTFNTGCFIIGVIGKGGDSIGGVSYYFLYPEDFINLVEYLMGDLDWMEADFGDITADAIKTIFNPFQYITSAMWFPVIPSSGVVLQTAIKFGYWTIPEETVTAFPLSASGSGVQDILGDPIDMTSHKHPQAASRGAYLNMSPYTRYTLYAGPFGIIPLDSTLMSDLSLLTISYKVDFITGQGWMSVKRGDDTPITTVRTMLGVPIAINSMGININGASGGIIKTAISGIAGAIVGGLSEGNAFGAIAGAASAALPQLESRGSTGSLIDYHTPMELIFSYMSIVDANDTHAGRPLCKERVISAIPGFIQCLDADVAITGTETEKDMIKSMMEAGFFYE